MGANGHMAYLILKVIRKWKNKDWSNQKWCLFYSQNKIVHCLNNYTKHVIMFLILQTFNCVPRLKSKRWVRTFWKWNTLTYASFSKMQPVLVHRLRFRSCGICLSPMWLKVFLVVPVVADNSWALKLIVYSLSFYVHIQVYTQSVTERRRRTLSTSSAYQNKTNCPYQYVTGSI
jgi:hypothetical protein